MFSGFSREHFDDSQQFHFQKITRLSCTSGTQKHVNEVGRHLPASLTLGNAALRTFTNCVTTLSFPHSKTRLRLLCLARDDVYFKMAAKQTQ